MKTQSIPPQSDETIGLDEHLTSEEEAGAEVPADESILDAIVLDPSSIKVGNSGGHSG